MSSTMYIIMADSGKEFAKKIARITGKTVTLRQRRGGSATEEVSKVTKKGKVSRSRSRKLSARVGSVEEKRQAEAAKAKPEPSRAGVQKTTYRDTQTGRTFTIRTGQTRSQALREVRAKARAEERQKQLLIETQRQESRALGVKSARQISEEQRIRSIKFKGESDPQRAELPLVGVDVSRSIAFQSQAATFEGLTPRASPVQRFKEERARGSGLFRSTGEAISQVEKDVRAERLKLKGSGKVFLPFAAGVTTSAIGTARGVKQVFTKPVETTKGIFKGAFRFGAGFTTGESQAKIKAIGKTIKTEPAFAAGFVTGELVGAKAIGKTEKFSAKQFGKARAFASPKFVKLKEGIISVPSKFKRGKFDIKIGGSVKELSEPVSKQVLLAGKKVDAVTAQRSLFGALERKKVIDKPLPTPTSPPLEKSLFLDPRGRLRPSRLGLTTQKEATIVDILKGKATFKKTKPQAFVIEQAPVEKFPAALKKIEQKLRKGKKLTPLEEEQLLKFQLEPSGQLKPVGFISREPEVTLAPTETFVRKEKLAETIIEGQRVPVFRAEIGKFKKGTAELVGKLDDLTPRQRKKLGAKITKETGIDVSSVIDDRALIRTSPALGQVPKFSLDPSRKISPSPRTFISGISVSPSISKTIPRPPKKSSKPTSPFKGSPKISPSPLPPSTPPPKRPSPKQPSPPRPRKPSFSFGIKPTPRRALKSPYEVKPKPIKTIKLEPRRETKQPTTKKKKKKKKRGFAVTPTLTGVVKKVKFTGVDKLTKTGLTIRGI